MLLDFNGNCFPKKSMSVLTLLLLGLLPILEALRPEMAFATEVDEDRTHTEKGDPSRVVNVTLKPGPHGLEWYFPSGRICSLEHGSQADKLGLKAGQHIIRVGTRPFSSAAFGEASSGSTEYTLLVELPSSMAVKAEKVIACLAMPAVVSSCILTLVLPFLISIHLFASNKWQVDMFSNQLSHPLPLIVLAAWACSWASFAALEWPYRHTTSIENARLGTDFCVIIGLLLGLRWNRNHEAFNKPLDSASASLLWKVELFAMPLCSMPVLILMAVVVGWTRDFDIRVILFLGGSFEYFMLFAFICQMCRMGAAKKQQMSEVQKGMPCLPENFLERVHKPCAELLQSSTCELVTCGWPPVLLAPHMVVVGFNLYQDVRYACLRPYFVNWLWTFFWAAELGAFLLAVSLLPLLLSSALKDFKTMLNQERQRDGTLHEQIEAVEAMMNSHNNGQGFGIPVFDGFVLTKEWLQMMGIRLALVATAIKAFLDTELGYAKEPEEAMMSGLVDVQSQLKNLHLVDMQMRNLTMLLGNYTNHTKHM